MEAELGIYKKPWLFPRLHFIKERIYTRLSELEITLCTDKEPIPFNERTSRLQKKAVPGQTWGKAFTCAWFNFKGQVPELPEPEPIVLIIDIDGEGLYVNDKNEPESSITSRLTWIDRFQATKGKTVIEWSDGSIGGEPVDLWVEAGFNGKIVLPFGSTRIKKAWIAACRDDIKEFYYDYLTLSFALAACEDAFRRKAIGRVLKSAYRAFKGCSKADVRKAGSLLHQVLDRPGADEGLTFTTVGHSHLDLAWLWPVRETRRKAIRTFTHAINNLKKYPCYVYGASQPQQFDWVKQDSPVLYSRIKDAVKEGRFELQGGMWVECDTNLPSGESLIRQIYYGKKFFREEFGQDMKICWLPDVFGYSASLPQILKKTGLDYFMTIKLSWNEHNTFPHRTFNWIGIDGSSVLVHMPPEGNYNSAGSPLSLKLGKDSFPERDLIDSALLVYGAGDGGGGPGEVHVELLKRQQNLEGLPRVRFGRADDFFEKLGSFRDRLKSFKGELYLEKHQGTYTTQARNKYFNRRMEFMLHDVEMLASIAFLKGRDYPHQLLERIWKEVLLYQFHDILPGSGIQRIYDESRKRYADMLEELEAEKRKIMDFLSQGSGKTFINTSAFDRREYIKSDGQWYIGDAKAYSTSTLLPANLDFDLKHGDEYIENEYLRVVFSKQGCISSLYDKANGVEFCSAYLNKLTVYTDKWMFFNAWDIDSSYPKKRKAMLRLTGSETFMDGPRVIRRNYYSHHRTTLKQDVVLTSGKKLVEFDTSCDWHETFKMLRADFSPTVWSDQVKCDIQFGSFDRSTNNDTSVEKAQFEICAHKWVDLSGESFGISLINDCKYGHRVKDGIISLNLLRSPVYPDATADRGEHHFRYALYPHQGNVTKGDTIKEGYFLNMPPLVSDSDIMIEGLVSADKKNIIIETIKKAEQHNGLIIRAYESFGQETSATISTSVPYLEAFECDMLEKPMGIISLDRLSFSSFEVKTFLLGL